MQPLPAGWSRDAERCATTRRAAANFYHDPPFPKGFVPGEPYTADTRLVGVRRVHAGRDARPRRSPTAGASIVACRLLSPAIRIGSSAAAAARASIRSPRDGSKSASRRRSDGVRAGACADAPPLSLHVSRDGGGARAAAVVATSARGARRAADAAIADVARIEAKYSRYRDDSVTTRDQSRSGRRCRCRSMPRRRRCCATPTRCHRAERRTLRHHVGRAAPRVGFPARAAATPDAGDARGGARADRLAARRVGRRTRCACRAPAWRSTSAASARSTRPIAPRRSASSTASRTDSSIWAATSARSARSPTAAPWRVGIRHPRATDARSPVPSNCATARSRPAATTSATSRSTAAAIAISSIRAPACRSRTGSR